MRDSLYAVEAHGKYLGEVPVGGLLGLFFPELTKDGWVDHLVMAHLFESTYEARRRARKWLPCTSLIRVSLQEHSCP